MLSVSVMIDSVEVIHFERKSSGSRPLEIADEVSYTFKSPMDFFRFEKIEVFKIDLEVQIIPTKQTHSLFSRLATASLKSKLPAKFIAEMNRTTKKHPPTSTQLRMLIANYDEYEASSNASNSILGALILTSSEQGQIYIGFPTHQV
jgi:hypothetical protein